MSNPMQEIYIDKVVVHMGVGESGERLVKAEKIMQQITGQKPVRTIAKRTQPAFGIRKGAPIGCKVTLRRSKFATAMQCRAQQLGILQLIHLASECWSSSCSSNAIQPQGNRGPPTSHTRFIVLRPNITNRPGIAFRAKSRI